MRSDRPRILYLSHIDWRWIKQRPQFIAEGLARSYDVEVAYRRLWRRSQLVHDEPMLVTHPIWRLPFRRFARSAAISRELERRRIERLVERWRPDVVWLCYPSFYDRLPTSLRRSARVVYDCMDDATAFAFGHERERVSECESALLDEAALVLCSSARLAEDLRARGAPGDRLQVVRNAYAGEVLPPVDLRSRAQRGDRLRAGYAGTIARWIDFDSLLAGLDALPGLEIQLLGPMESNVVLPRHPRLSHRGPVPHEAVPRAARDWDVLLMPFVRSPLIERVDPVKLYEYINLDRPIVATRYPEIARFDAFADLYSTPHELIERLRTQFESPRRKYTPAQRSDFLAENAWANRVRDIVGLLEPLL